MKNIQDLYSPEKHPIKFVQFGEGNFLRAFVDYGIDCANEANGFDASTVLIIPIEQNSARMKGFFKEQKNLYTVCLRGNKDGKAYKENRVVKCVDQVVGAYSDYEKMIALADIDTLQFVVSNTTEAGIVYEGTEKLTDTPPKSYPAKLTQFLYRRFKTFNGAHDKGLIVLPVELIDHNGEHLKDCINKYIKLWNLEAEFQAWVDNDCIIASTLVDRIVAGYPRAKAPEYEEELGYHDNLIDQAEPFGLWVIGDSRVEKKLPLNSDKLHVLFTDEIEKFKERKVRILNGAHTSMVLGAYLAGFDIVRDCMHDPDVRKQLDESVYGEIVPTVHLPIEESKQFAASVFDRFDNPFVDHQLLSISLNSISKWRARVLPSFKDSIANNNGKLPKWLTYSFAALLAFYHTTKKGEGCLIGSRGTNEYDIKDDPEKLDKIAEWSALSDHDYVHTVMTQTEWWGEDLTAIAGFEDAVQKHFADIQSKGAKQVIHDLGAE